MPCLCKRVLQRSVVAGTSSQGRASAVGGFTLIELLVVISVIALLVAILLPTLASARYLARRTACLSNERQISIATYGYFGDFNDYVPFGKAAPPFDNFSGWAQANCFAWYVRLAPYVNIPTRPGANQFYALGSNSAGLTGPVVFTCPEEAAEIDFSNSTSRSRPVSYAPTSRAAVGAPLINGVHQGRALDIARPASKLWIMEQLHLRAMAGVNGARIAPGENDYDIFFDRHGDQAGGVNGLFFDGHARWVTYDEVKSPGVGYVGFFNPYEATNPWGHN